MNISPEGFVEMLDPVFERDQKIREPSVAQATMQNVSFVVAGAFNWISDRLAAAHQPSQHSCSTAQHDNMLRTDSNGLAQQSPPVVT